MKYIDKDALVAEIEKLISNGQTKLKESEECHDYESYVAWAESIATCIKVLSLLNTLEVKEVDLEKEIDLVEDKYHGFESLSRADVIDVAKHFFELGLNASNPIAKENLESFVRQVIDLDIEAGEYYNNIIEEERKENRGSFLMINLLNGNLDAKELGIQYVLNKLKAQKGM